MTISRTLQDSLLPKLQNIHSQRSGGVGSSYFDTNQISRGSFAEFDHLVTTVTLIQDNKHDNNYNLIKISFSLQTSKYSFSALGRS